MSRILLIEDDANMALALEYNLVSEGYTVTVCRDGESGLKAALESDFDLLVLDWMLPEMDGIQLLKTLRTTNNTLPVLLLTARESKEDVVEGLDSGADDYLTKPFDLNVLQARIRSLLRSRSWVAQKEKTDEARFGDVWINFQNFEAQINGRTVRLSYKEAMIMKLFWEKRNQVISREELLQKVWGIHEYVQSRSLDNFIVQLRKRFEKNPKAPELILSIHGTGYKFVGGED